MKNMLKNKTKNVVIASVMALFLLAVMIPVTQAISTPTNQEAEPMPEMITMEELLKITGSTLIEPTEEYMANLEWPLYVDTFED